MNSVLLWIGGLLIAALGLLFAVPYVVDWNSYRGVFEEEASRLLGRDVRVGGKVNLRLLPAPYVRFEKVRISDTNASLGEPFFRTESFTLWLSAMPLLRGAIEANEIELDRPVLRLAIAADGTGNWQTLRPAPGAISFIPSDVVLQQIRIRNGTVSVKTADRAEPVELSNIDGELSATALSGPYRFRGSVNWGGGGREVRVAVAPADEQGRIRFRINLRVPETSNTYSFDGGLSELTSRASLDGTLTARLPIRATQPDKSQAAAPKGAGETRVETRVESRGGASDQNGFDFKAAVLGNFDGVKLSDIEIAFEQDGKPQMVTGQATAQWRGDLRLETQLTSRWLDLDRIASNGATRPLDATREMIERIGAMLPTTGTTFATLDVDQVNLGGESLSGMRLALARVAGRTSIGELKAGLPGNARATVRGTLGAGGDPKAFEGEIVLRGASYQRFSHWASSTGQEAASTAAASGQLAQDHVPVPGQSKGDGAFSLASRLKMLPGRLELSDASVEFAGAQLQGDLEWTWSGEKELRVSIDGATVDVSALAPGLLDFESWRGGVGKDSAGAPSPGRSPLAALGAKARLVNAAVGNLRVKVRAQTVTDGTNALRDVNADLSFQPDGLVIPGLKFISPDGVLVDVQGEIKGLESKPTGRLKGWLSARGGASTKALAGALSGGDSPIQATWAGRVSRVDLGFAAALGGSTADQLTVRANGAIDDGRVDLALTLRGGLNGWRNAPVDVSLHIESPEMPNLVRRMVSGRDPAPTVVGSDSAPGSLVLKALGIPAADMASYLQLDLGGVGMTYSGRSKVAGDGAIDLLGDLNVVAADAGDLFTLLGANRRPMLHDIGVDGVLAVTRDAGKARFEARSLAIGSSRVSGQIDVSAADDRVTLGGHLTASEASIPTLLGLVLDGREAAAGGEGRGEVGSPWSDTSFALGVLDNVVGRIDVSAPTLKLTSDLAVSQAEMTFEIGPGRVSMSKLTGKAMGGQFTARSTIERAAGGASVAIDAQLDGAKLGQLASAGGTGSADFGEARVAMKLSGRGGNPRAVLSVMAGTGEIELRNARVRGIAPAAIDVTGQQLIDGQDEIGRDMLERLVRSAFAKSEIGLAATRLPIEIADGAARIAALQFETADARIRNVTTVDLAQLKADSEWQVAPKKPLAGRRGALVKAPLPPVILVWSGPIATIARGEPRLSIETLEREITVRRMERDVERLEDLRRQDELRARQESERLRQFDNSAQGPGAATANTPPVIQAPFLIQAPRPAPAPAPAQSGASGTPNTNPPTLRPSPKAIEDALTRQ